MNCIQCGSFVKVGRKHLTYRNLYVPGKLKRAMCEFFWSVTTSRLIPRTHKDHCLSMHGSCSVLLHMKPPWQGFIMKTYGYLRWPWLTGTPAEKYLSTMRRETRWRSVRPGCIVEVDEAKFVWRMYNRGRIVEGQWRGCSWGLDRQTLLNIFLHN